MRWGRCVFGGGVSGSDGHANGTFPNVRNAFDERVRFPRQPNVRRSSSMGLDPLCSDFRPPKHSCRPPKHSFFTANHSVKTCKKSHKMFAQLGDGGPSKNRTRNRTFGLLGPRTPNAFRTFGTRSMPITAFYTSIYSIFRTIAISSKALPSPLQSQGKTGSCLTIHEVTSFDKSPPRLKGYEL